MLATQKTGMAGLVLAAGLLAACGGGGSSDSSTTSTVSASSSSSSSTPASSTGATGWASVSATWYSASSTSAATTGGAAATTAKTYTVSNRNELIQALYGNSATINTNGSFSGTLDSSAKIIYVSGTISLNMNKALTELTADDYVTGSCAYSSYNYSTADAMWSAYYTAFAPVTWNTSLVLSSGKYVPNAVSGDPESARVCAYALQKKVVALTVPSNTSIIGLGDSAKIIHGNLVIGASSSAPADNVVIRNITFEDAFDFFPQWDPTDSFPSVTDTTSVVDTNGCSYSAPTYCVGGRWNAQYDNISVMYATHVWIDHNTFSDGSRIDANYGTVSSWYFGSSSNKISQATEQHVQHHDGLVDITKTGSYVTLSYNEFFNHDKSFNLGGTDTPSTTAENPTVLKITFNNNYFLNLKQRQARMRYGMIHMYNNYYEGTLDSTANYPWSVAWTVGQAAKAYMENNAFVISSSGTAAAISNLFGTSISSSKITTCTGLSYTTAQCAAYFYDTGTLLNGSSVSVGPAVTSSNSAVTNSAYWTPSDYYTYSPAAASTLSTTVSSNAGAGKI